MGKSAPKPPDPAEVAGAQTANNVGTAIANQVLGNVNQITPTGSLTYYFNGPDGQLVAPGDWSGSATTGTVSTAIEPSTPQQVSTTRNWNNGNGITYDDTPISQPEPTVAEQQAAGTGPSSGAFQWTDPNTGNVYNIPQMTAVQSLSPEEQAIFDAGQGTRQNLADLANMVSGQMQDHFATPFSLDGLPEGGSAQNLNTPTYQGLNGIQRMSTTGPQSNANQFAYGFDAPGISASIGDAGDIRQEFGDAGEITRTYGTDFSEDRRRVEEALMSRLNPSLERDKESLRTSLLNQGIREGSEAYDRAMNRANEQSTDARMQAILAGGQEQSRLADLEAQRAGFENAAQQQAYNQLYGRADFYNQGQQQRFGQMRDRASLSLQGQIANSNQALQQAQLRNSALQAAFGQDLASRTFSNSAIGQNNALAFQEANFGNNLADRQFSNDIYMQDRMDADRQRAIEETLLMRNQPINEIGALLGTGQVSMPNFVNTSGASMPTVDRAGLEQAAYGQELANWQNQQAMMGSILGIGGQVLGAGIGAGGIWT